MLVSYFWSTCTDTKAPACSCIKYEFNTAGKNTKEGSPFNWIKAHSSLDEWAIGRMASWLIIKQSTDCKSLNLIYTFMFWKWSIINMFLQLVEAFNKMGYFKLLKLSSSMLQEHSFYHCCQRKVWPEKSRQMSLKVAQKWYH